LFGWLVGWFGCLFVWFVCLFVLFCFVLFCLFVLFVCLFHFYSRVAKACGLAIAAKPREARLRGARLRRAASAMEARVKPGEARAAKVTRKARKRSFYQFEKKSNDPRGSETKSTNR
jgi:hypothetical protein